MFAVARDKKVGVLATTVVWSSYFDLDMALDPPAAGDRGRGVWAVAASHTAGLENGSATTGDTAASSLHQRDLTEHAADAARTIPNPVATLAPELAARICGAVDTLRRPP